VPRGVTRWWDGLEGLCSKCTPTSAFPPPL